MYEELRARVREALTGPVCSIPTPFRASDDAIDYDAIAKMIDFQIANGLKMIFLTPGNSHFDILTHAEMAELAKFVVEYTNKRALVCVTEFNNSTARMKEFSKYCAEIGADLFLPFNANWAGSCTSETIEAYYLEAAQNIALLLIYPGRSSDTAAIPLIENLMKKTDAVMAIKDDCCNKNSRVMTLKFAERLAIFSSGQKQNYLNIWPMGATGYLSTLGMFRPDLSWQFWKACQARNLEGMMEIVSGYDMPYFDLIMKQPGGFDAGIRATMEMFGMGTRYRRLPYRNLTDAEYETFKQGLIDLKIIK
ncbi:MAG: dihydrodipicolinate synthase family protein [Victivallales bacterium]|nr:dihydrodipicolinate synthase family protein [Victivallales bacterium]